MPGWPGESAGATIKLLRLANVVWWKPRDGMEKPLLGLRRKGRLCVHRVPWPHLGGYVGETGWEGALVRSEPQTERVMGKTVRDAGVSVVPSLAHVFFLEHLQ